MTHQEKYGFVYIWYDMKRKMYYIGCHWGYEDDGYICSSNRMRDAYRRRPHDFKRRVIKRIYTNRTEMLEEEYKYINLIKDHELGRKYYNHNNMHFGHWTATDKANDIKDRIKKTHWSKDLEKAKEVRKKLSKAGKERMADPEVRKALSKKVSDTMTPEHKKRLSEIGKVKHGTYERTEKHLKELSERTKKQVAEGKFGNKGKKFSKEHRRKMSENNAMNNPVHVDKIREAKKGIKYLNKDGKNKMAVPGTDKWNELRKLGYKEGRI